jgi:hypothetical protein
MTESGELANRIAASSPAIGGAAAPSYYRVSVVSGSLEVSARLRNAADLELLIRVLEANNVLFANEDQPVESVGTSPPVAKADRPQKKTSARATQSRRAAFADDPEAEILTLT